MNMDASWLYRAHLVALLCLPLIHVVAQYPNNPSTNWTLADYYASNISYSSLKLYLRVTRYRNFSICNNQSSLLELLNEQEKGLYGRSTGIYSAHAYMPYSVYFSLYFVTPAEMVCLKDNNGSNTPAYYLSVVARNRYESDPNKCQVVWTANPNKPVTKNACLHLNDGDLTLVDYHNMTGSSGDTVWQAKTGAARNVSLAISFEGNLFLFSNTTDPPYLPVWESFQYPTDTLMVLQILKNDANLTVNPSATSNSGNYSLVIQNGRLKLYVKTRQLIGDQESQYGSPYWVWPSPNSSVPLDDHSTFAVLCWDPVNQLQLRLYDGSNRLANDSTEYEGMVSPEFCSTIPNNSERSMQITGLETSINATYASFLRLEADGDLHAYSVENTSYSYLVSNATWRSFYSVFNSTPCHLPLYCGSYGMCVPQGGGGSVCTCNYSDDANPQMVASDPSNPQSGCTPGDSSKARLWDPYNLTISRQTNTCLTDDVQKAHACSSNSSGCAVEFIRLNNVHYFSLNFTDSYETVQEGDGCETKCKTNCSCTAAFWDVSTARCFLVVGRLGTIQQQQGTMQAFIKYVKITPHSSVNYTWIVVGSVLGALLVVGGIFLAYWRKRRARKLSMLRMERLLLLSLLEGSSIESFTWKQMHEYTCGFSDLLGGGGFGRVFRGALPDGTAIAVKQLDEDGSQGQGDKEFIAEVSILSRIHHAHLVHLIGFCLEGTHRLLVYEYMENGSLDTWLFKKDEPSMLLQEAEDGPQQQQHRKGMPRLPWKRRFQIAVGTAKGLAYLHEECEDRVIHMDLKPQNILLGRGFQAKISDFGMSRRTAREQTSVMTVMRGTPGYLAPEWLLDCAITEKCDVYSFGIVLLEMVSGKKVKDLREVKQKLLMRPLRQSVMLDFVDERVRYDIDVEEKEAVRMVEVALMCVRTDPTRRPAMNSVVLMLEGKEDVVRQVAEDEYDENAYDALKQEMVRYPSTRNRSLRVVQSFKVDNRSFTDSASNSSSYIWHNADYNSLNYTSSQVERKKKKYFNIDHNQSPQNRSSSSPSTEWDRLLSE